MSGDKDRDAWLLKLKVGDEVAISQGGWSRTYNFVKVTRLSDATVWVSEHQKFWRTGRKAGDRVGSSYDTTYIVQPTQEMRDSMRERKLRIVMRDYPVQTLSLDQVERIVAIMREPKTADNATGG